MPRIKQIVEAQCSGSRWNVATKRVGWDCCAIMREVDVLASETVEIFVDSQTLPCTATYLLTRVNPSRCAKLQLVTPKS